jgi:hypothetical protein
MSDVKEITTGSYTAEQLFNAVRDYPGLCAAELETLLGVTTPHVTTGQLHHMTQRGLLRREKRQFQNEPGGKHRTSTRFIYFANGTKYYTGFEKRLTDIKARKAAEQAPAAPVAPKPVVDVAGLPLPPAPPVPKPAATQPKAVLTEAEQFAAYLEFKAMMKAMK